MSGSPTSSPVATLTPSAGPSASVTMSPTSNDTGDVLPISEALLVMLALIAASIATLIALFNVYKHLTNYTRPELQRPITRILLIVPFYAVFSWLSLAFPNRSVVFESLRDCWEAVVIYEFLKLILAYCGGESACLLVIMKNPGSISHMCPLNYCLPRITLDARFMRVCKRLTLQFVFIKPVMAIVNIVMFETGQLENSTYQMSQLIVYNISYSCSLYGLVLFYLATHHHPGLKSRHPIVKFLSVKLIIFATYYQGLFVQLAPGFSGDELSTLNNFILCWEMVGFGILHAVAFGWCEFRGGSQGVGDSMDGELGLGTNVLSLELEEVHAGANRPKNNAIHNVRDAIGLQDVATDAMQNFDSKYDAHVMLDTKDPGAPDYDEEDVDDQHDSNPFQHAHGTSSSSQFAPSPSSSPPPFTSAPHSSNNARGSNHLHNNPRDEERNDNPFAISNDMDMAII